MSKVVGYDKVTIKLSPEVKSWYENKAKSYPMSMCGFIQYILTDYYEKQLNANAVRALSEFNSSEDSKINTELLARLVGALERLDGITPEQAKEVVEQIETSENISDE